MDINSSYTSSHSLSPLVEAEETQTV